MTSPTDDVDAPSPPRSWVKRAIAWVVIALLAGGVAFLWVERDRAAKEAGPPVRKRARKAKATPVTTLAPERRTFVASSTFRGELDADTADIGATLAGRLVDVTVRLGDRVAANAQIATVDSQTMRAQRDALVARVEAARAAVRGANVAYGAAKTERVRMERLAKEGATSEQAADAARATASSQAAGARVARADLATARANLSAADQALGEAIIRAPFDGVVTARMQDPGDFVQTGTPVVRIVRTGELRVRFDVPEQHVATISPGLVLKVRAAATGDKEAKATIRGLAAEVDRERRVLVVEAVVANPPASWVSGMYAEVIVPRLTLVEATVVPESAVLSRRVPDGSVEDGLFVATGDKATWVRVRVLAREGGSAAVEAVIDAVGVRPSDAAGDATGKPAAVSTTDSPLGPAAQVLVSGHSDLADGASILPTARTQPVTP